MWTGWHIIIIHTCPGLTPSFGVLVLKQLIVSRRTREEVVIILYVRFLT